MKLRIKLAATGAMALAAAVCAAAAIGSITGPAGAEEPESVLVWPEDSSDAEFILREADRALLNAGLPCADRDEVLTLLEDLGS